MRGFRPDWFMAGALTCFLAVAAATIVALAQTSGLNDPELRLRPSDIPELLRDERESGRSRREERPVGQIPRFGTPPAAGAGRTGFVSSRTGREVDRRRTTRNRSRASPSPLNLSPTPGTRPADTQALAQTIPPATQPRRAGGAAGPVRDPATDPTRPVVPPRQRRSVEDDPFEQAGFYAGALLVKPAAEVTGGYDSNPARVRDGRGSWFGIAGADMQVRSDWQRHDFRADIRGTYTAFESDSTLDRPFLDARARTRIDVFDQTRIEAEGRYLLSTDNPGSPDLPADIAKLPIFTSAGTTIGLVQGFNRFELAARGTFDRFDYRNSKLLDGSSVSNRDRDYDQYGGIVRASYELVPGIKPFVEVNADHRDHDLTVDRFGQRRNSDGWAVKAGTTFDVARSFTGEVAAGYLSRHYDDPALPDLSGALVDAALIWTATGLTTMTFRAATAADESTLPGVSGVMRRDASLQVDHAWRRWLVSTIRAGYGSDDYRGSPREDDRYMISAALTYKLARFAQIKGEFRQEWLRSSEPGHDYDASIGLIGVRWQP